MEYFKAQTRKNNGKKVRKNKTRQFGSIRSRNRARVLLKAEWIDGDTWKVSGGESEHTVVVGKDHRDPRTYTCDCGAKEQSPYQVCSHMMCVYYEL